ncbi:hypothetical protein V6N13_132875 [Hibiscus sabdariffa]
MNIADLILPPLKEARLELCSSSHHVASIHHLNPQRGISVDGDKKLLRITVGAFGLWQGVVGVRPCVNDNRGCVWGSESEPWW